MIDGGLRTATVTALTPVEVLVVAACHFNGFLERHPKVVRNLLVEVIGRLRTRVRHQLEIGAGDALGRVCARLVELAERYGKIDGEDVVINSPVTQSDLAAWAGLSRETVVKTLRMLRRWGWLETRGRTIRIREMEEFRRRATH